MKVIGAFLLILASSFLATTATAQHPIPFQTLAHAANMPPSLADLGPAPVQAAPAPAPPKQHHAMTTGGKIMTGVGIGLAGIGVLLVAAGADSPGNNGLDVAWRKLLYGGGAVFAGGGATLIYFGVHRRKKN